ncbi:MAG: dihydrofolate reductase [Cytophagales bacterium]|nr:dihydrofolate reductase [Cytophagales bacterium]
MESSRKIISYIAMSLDGKIARLDGAVDGLDDVKKKKKSDYGYDKFYDGIDVTIQGGATYREVLGFDVDFPYAEKENYVFTRNTSLTKDENVEFISSDFESFIRDLKQKKGKDIWLVGGGQLNSIFLKDGWLDEIRVFIMPIVLSEGLPLFAEGLLDTPVALTNTTTYSSGVVELTYTCHE